MPNLPAAPATPPRICFIPMENTAFPIIGNANWPKLTALVNGSGGAAGTGGYTHHIGFYDTLSGVQSPSGPNYQAVTFGTTSADGVAGQYFADDGFHNITLTSIYDRLRVGGLKFGAFAESLTAGGAIKGNGAGYLQRHFAISYCSPYNTTNSYTDATTGSLVRDAGSAGTAHGITGSDTNFAGVNAFSAMLTDMGSTSPAAFYYAGPCYANQGHSGSTAAPWGSSVSGSKTAADAFAAHLVGLIQATTWYTQGNGNIIVWWDENSAHTGGLPGEHTEIIVINEGPAHLNGGRAFGNASTGQLSHLGLLHDILGAYQLADLGHSAAQTGSISTLISTGGVVVGPATKLVMGQQPTSVAAGVTMPPVTVKIEDTNGNTVTGATNAVSLAIATNPPGTGVLTGGGAVTPVNGVATFGSLSINVAGTGYTLQATSSPVLSPVTTGFFNINSSVGPAAKVVMRVQPPATTVPSTNMAPPIQVAIEDAAGNVVTTSSSNVVATISTDPTGGTAVLSNATVAASSGIATFTNLQIDTVATGYRLTFTSTGFTVISALFNIATSGGGGGGGRDPLKQPYLPTSIWNLPIGHSATYQAFPLAPTIKTMTHDQTIILMDPTQPLTNIQHATTRCSGDGTVLATVPMANSFFTGVGTTNNGMAAVLANGHSDVQAEPFCRSAAGATPTVAFLRSPNDDLLTLGLTGARGASALSIVGGTLRLGELLPSSPPIPHVLAVNFDFFDLSAAGGNQFRWPATKQDGYPYTGASTTMVPGVLVALLPSFNVAGLLTAPGRAIATCLMNYGMYGVNDTKRSVFSFTTELSPAGDVTTEFAAAWGFAFETASNVDATPWAQDLRAILAAAQIVSNNTLANYTLSQSTGSGAGGGTPRVPLAPPFGSGPVIVIGSGGVQSAGATDVNATNTLTVPFPNPTTPGNLVGMMVAIRGSATISVSDGTANSYAQDVYNPSATEAIGVWHSLTTAPTSSVTAVASAGCTMEAWAWEVSGVDGAVTATAIGAEANDGSPTSGTLVALNPGDLVLAGFAYEGTDAASALTTGYTAEPTLLSNVPSAPHQLQAAILTVPSSTGPGTSPAVGILGGPASQLGNMQLGGGSGQVGLSAATSFSGTITAALNLGVIVQYEATVTGTVTVSAADSALVIDSALVSIVGSTSPSSADFASVSNAVTKIALTVAETMGVVDRAVGAGPGTSDSSSVVDNATVVILPFFSVAETALVTDHATVLVIPILTPGKAKLSTSVIPLVRLTTRVIKP